MYRFLILALLPVFITAQTCSEGLELGSTGCTQDSDCSDANGNTLTCSNSVCICPEGVDCSNPPEGSNVVGQYQSCLENMQCAPHGVSIVVGQRTDVCAETLGCVAREAADGVNPTAICHTCSSCTAQNDNGAYDCKSICGEDEPVDSDQPNGDTNDEPNGDTNDEPNGDTNDEPNGDTNGDMDDDNDEPNGDMDDNDDMNDEPNGDMDDDNDDLNGDMNDEENGEVSDDINGDSNGDLDDFDSDGSGDSMDDDIGDIGNPDGTRDDSDDEKESERVGDESSAIAFWTSLLYVITPSMILLLC